MLLPVMLLVITLLPTTASVAQPYHEWQQVYGSTNDMAARRVIKKRQLPLRGNY